MARHDRLRHIDQLPTGPSGSTPQHVEGSSFVDRVPLHEDPLCPFGHRSPGERPLQVVVLGEPSKHDVHRALQLAWVLDPGEVGEDASLGRFPDEAGVLDIQDGDHGAGRLVNDLVDHVQSVRGAFAHDDDGNVGPFGHRHRADPLEIRLEEHDMADRSQDFGQLAQPLGRPVDRQDPKNDRRLRLFHGP